MTSPGKQHCALLLDCRVTAYASVQGLLAYGCGFPVSSMEMLKACTPHLPAYIVPQDVLELRKMPFNSNGRIDYPALQKMTKEGGGKQMLSTVLGPDS